MPGVTKNTVLIALLGGAIALSLSPMAEAQSATARIDQVSEAFQDAVVGMSSKLAVIARNLMMSLLLIELIWKLGKTIVAGDDFGKLMSVFFKRIVIAGFFLAIVDGIPTNSGQIGFGTFIINSAEALTNESVGTASIKPSDLFWQMLNSGGEIYANSSGLGGTVTAAIVWVLMSIMGAVVVGLMIVTYIEIYVIFTVGILALGFGAWSVTEQFATNFLFSAVGKTLKLFTMILMGSVIALQIEAFGTLTEFEDGLIVVGIVIIFIMLMSSVPQAVEQIISGIPAVSGDGAIAGALTGAAMKGARIGASGATKGAGAAAQKGASAALKSATFTNAKSGLASRIRALKGSSS